MEWQNRFSQLELTPQDPLPDLVVSYLSSWNTIYVIGEDCRSYLQGQLTCDLVSMGSDKSTLGAHCDAKGKVWSIFQCFQHQEGYALFHHASTTDVALREIKKYSVFSKVEISVSSDVALAIIGSNADTIIDALSQDRGQVRKLAEGSAVRVAENRWLIVINNDAVNTLLDSMEGAQFVDDKIWDKCEIEAGIPRVIEANQNAHIPQAFNLQAINGISFTKGCYTGQETVARAKYRGTNKRAMYIVTGHLEDQDSVLPELERKVGENWRSVGSLFAHYCYADGTAIGLIILPTTLESDTELRLANTPESLWSIKDLPYQLNLE